MNQLDLSTFNEFCGYCPWQWAYAQLAESDLLPSISLGYLGLSLIYIIRKPNVLLHIDNFLIFFSVTEIINTLFLRFLIIKVD